MNCMRNGTLRPTRHSIDSRDFHRDSKIPKQAKTVEPTVRTPVTSETQQDSRFERVPRVGLDDVATHAYHPALDKVLLRSSTKGPFQVKERHSLLRLSNLSS
ncbi:uncharacterized protein FOMMEDRAFT_18277 [Fomitiporia mediterranea MF3/22]|uniref:uncharacterized protein n=1 Tax=Fomitiporia mediterranea (strain MF3/22) TaxID=694068 RepID=UPI0004407591|nr:uncharacterized protein FOMMEDRAFT_18277 [Fomitiporia mediterranea MF3/22]EJD06076.1 hypothetical protein FOMMEDRAFT_18277 [Fomitiporia mediterranea MF3/22]